MTKEYYERNFNNNAGKYLGYIKVGYKYITIYNSFNKKINKISGTKEDFDRYIKTAFDINNGNNIIKTINEIINTEHR